MSEDLSAPSQFSIFKVLKDTFSVLKHNFSKVAVAAVVYILVWQTVLLIADDSSPDEFSWWNFAIGEVWGAVVGGLANAALIYGILLALSGSRPSIRDLLRGLSFGVPVIAVLIIISLPSTASTLVGAGNPGQIQTMWVQVLIGLAGYVLYVMWFAAPPVVIAEGLGALAALRRSILLTAEKRWHIFGLVFMCGTIFEVLAWLTREAAFGPSADPLGALAILMSWISVYVLPAVTLAFWAVLGTVTYCALRLAKEGADVRALAPVST